MTGEQEQPRAGTASTYFVLVTGLASVASLAGLRGAGAVLLVSLVSGVVLLWPRLRVATVRFMRRVVTRHPFAAGGATAALIGLTAWTILAQPEPLVAPAPELELELINVTSGDITPWSSVNAHVDDLIRVVVTIRNPPGGRELMAPLLTVRMPPHVGQEAPIVASLTAEGIRPIVEQTAARTAVTTRFFGEFLDNSTQWLVEPKRTHNLPDGVAEGGLVLDPIPPGESLSLTAEYRLRASVVSIQTKVRATGKAQFAVRNEARPGGRLTYVLIVKNEGNTPLKAVRVRNNLPPLTSYVPGTTRVVNSLDELHGDPFESLEGIPASGMTIEDMNPGTTQYVLFDARIRRRMPTGRTVLENVGIVQPFGLNEFFNVAFTEVYASAP